MTGDIFEAKTPSGLAYFQYTHDGADMGQLVRVLPGLFDNRPNGFGELAEQKELYLVFYSLNSALRNDQVEFVSHQPVPEWARPYPMMRWAGARDASGKTVAWKIFSASSRLTLEEHEQTPVIHNLTPQQERLSIHHLWAHPVMIKELARGWTPERAEELRLRDVTEAEKQRANPLPDKNVSMRHYLSFPISRMRNKLVNGFANEGSLQKFVRAQPVKTGLP